VRVLPVGALALVDEVLFLDGAPYSLDAYFGASVRLAPFIVVECPAVLIVAAVLRALRCPILILSMTGVVIVLSTSERWGSARAASRAGSHRGDFDLRRSLQISNVKGPAINCAACTALRSGDGVDSVLGVTQPGLGVVRNHG
jgi:hypothetical protein